MNQAIEAISKQSWQLSSPDSRLQINVLLDSQGRLTYDITKNAVAMLQASPLGIVTDRIACTDGLSFVNTSTVEINETYMLPHGKTKHYINQANELTLNFSKEGHMLQLICRGPIADKPRANGIRFASGSAC
jgi:alpha-glucosidase